MKIFISWSGPLSHDLGEALRNWLPAALQLVKPYFTPSDIEKGARWNPEIAAELETSQIGIFCMTSQNLENPWILFEAGAISKRIDKSRVCPILFEVEPGSLPGPLSQFQATPFRKAEVHKLMKTVNAALGEHRLDDATLDSVFEMWWPKLEETVNGILRSHEQQAVEPPRDERELLLEILELSRLAARRPISTAVSPRAVTELVSAFVATHDSLKNGGDEDTMNLLRDMSRPIAFLVSHTPASIRSDLDAALKKLTFEIEDIPF